MKKFLFFLLSISFINIYGQCTSGVYLNFILLDDISDFEVETYHFTITNEFNEIEWEYEDWAVTSNKHFEIQLPIGNYKLNWLNGGAQIFAPTIQLEHGVNLDWMLDSIQNQNLNYWNYFVVMPFTILEAYNCDDTLVFNAIQSDSLLQVDTLMNLENDSQSETLSDASLNEEIIKDHEELFFYVNNNKSVALNKDLDNITLSDINGKTLKIINSYHANSDINIESIERNTILFIKTVGSQKTNFFKFFITH